MSERLKTLVLYARRVPKVRRLPRPLGGWDLVAAGLRAAERRVRQVRNRLRGQAVAHPQYESLSYVSDWKEAICAAPELDVTCCDISNVASYWACRRQLRTWPLVIILHSATGDDVALLRRTEHWFQQRRGRLVVFIGNEYDLLEDKLGFLQATGAEFVCSQLPLQSARWLYSECLATQVLSMPHALNPRVYTAPGNRRRSIDIGFRGDSYGRIIGDRERDHVIEFFARRSGQFGLAADIQLNQRLTRSSWAAFLARCHGIIGAESGTYYLDRRAAIIEGAKRYVRAHPDSDFDEVYQRFFRQPTSEYVSGKCISSRHFEPVGTHTCQILMEGRYNGILHADQHYIAIRKDLSNIDEAIQRFKDASYRREMVQRTYEYVMDQHTYRHRVAALVQRIAA